MAPFVYGFLFIFGFLIFITYVENFRKFNQLIFPLEGEVIKFLGQYYPFYKKMPFRRKRRFEVKVKSFLNSFEYLLRGRDPDEIAKDSTDMATARTAIRGLGDGEHYGRPYAWHKTPRTGHGQDVSLEVAAS